MIKIHIDQEMIQLKKLIALFGMIILLLTGCETVSPNEFIEKPQFAGTVEEVSENTLLIKVDEEEAESKSSDKISVSLDMEIPEDPIEFHVGDRVVVLYDGAIAESYPAQIHNVFTILLLEAAEE